MDDSWSVCVLYFHHFLKVGEVASTIPVTNLTRQDSSNQGEDC